MQNSVQLQKFFEYMKFSFLKKIQKLLPYIIGFNNAIEWSLTSILNMCSTPEAVCIIFFFLTFHACFYFPFSFSRKNFPPASFLIAVKSFDVGQVPFYPLKLVASKYDS